MLFCVRKLPKTLPFVDVLCHALTKFADCVDYERKLLTQVNFTITICSEVFLHCYIIEWVVGKIYPGKMNTRVPLSFNLIINKMKMSFSTIELFPFLWLLFLYLLSLKFYCDLNNYHEIKIRTSIFAGYIEPKT